MIEESARIARGDVLDISKLDANNYDALIIPGGFGAAKNLSNFAFKGDDMEVDKDVCKILKDFHSHQKVIKVSRAATSNELVIKKNCDAVGFNYCSDKYLRVEVFSGTDSICDLAVELSTEENIYYLSRTHATTGNLFLSTCGNETKCYTNSSLTLFRKTKNKFEFTIQRKDGFLNSKILYRNLNATQSTGPYKNHYLSNMITPFP